MEDYLGAFVVRKKDVEVLLAPNPSRCVGAVHFGGVAIECRLKFLILKYHRIAAWDEPGKRLRDSMLNHPIGNPGHGIMQALRLMPDIYRRAKADRYMLAHLSAVVSPVGATNLDYISMRYVARSLTAQAVAQWRHSYDYVVGWLDKNEAYI